MWTAGARGSSSVQGDAEQLRGGRTPWDTWLSCEETEDVRDQPHGYVFEVDPYDQAQPGSAADQGLGRFPHEAVVVDPEEQQPHLSEDAFAPNGLLYCGRRPRMLRRSARACSGTWPMTSCPARDARDSDGRHAPDLSLASEIGTTYQMTRTVPD